MHFHCNFTAHICSALWFSRQSHLSPINKLSHQLIYNTANTYSLLFVFLIKSPCVKIESTLEPATSKGFLILVLFSLDEEQLVKPTVYGNVNSKCKHTAAVNAKWGSNSALHRGRYCIRPATIHEVRIFFKCMKKNMIIFTFGIIDIVFGYILGTKGN